MRDMKEYCQRQGIVKTKRRYQNRWQNLPRMEGKPKPRKDTRRECNKEFLKAIIRDQKPCYNDICNNNENGNSQKSKKSFKKNLKVQNEVPISNLRKLMDRQYLI